MENLQNKIEEQLKLKTIQEQLKNEFEEKIKPQKEFIKNIETEYKPKIKELDTNIKSIREEVIKDINDNSDEYLKKGKTQKFFDYTLSITEKKVSDVKKQWKLLSELKKLDRLDIVKIKFDEKQLIEIIKAKIIDTDIVDLKSEYNYMVKRLND